ncbi:2-hydroxyacid dehydrogenase [Actinophytocola sp.]|uniref:2-hydroxyacid dehydrogenase n=1 Tax=Actinophytocola sp. TaxID=1872138 RepID=UPI002ED0958E
MVNVLVTDPLIVDYLDEPDWEVFTHRTDTDVEARLPNTDVLIASRVTESMAAAATRLRLLHVPGAGLDRIAIDALPPHATVCNTFHHGRSIAEHVVMVSLMLARRVLLTDHMLRQGKWVSAAVDPDERPGHTLAGRIVGVVGLGEIGQAVVRALTTLGMRAQAVRRTPTAPDGLALDRVADMSGLDDLLSTSDIVVLTVPLTADTHTMIDARRLALMRRDAVLVNVARGPLVDEDALFDALSAGRIGGAALDVWWGHPKDGAGAKGYTRPFELLDNVVLTPHNSGHTHETFAGRAAEIKANVRRLTGGRPLTNVVRPGR